MIYDFSSVQFIEVLCFLDGRIYLDLPSQSTQNPHILWMGLNFIVRALEYGSQHVIFDCLDRMLY